MEMTLDSVVGMGVRDWTGFLFSPLAQLQSHRFGINAQDEIQSSWCEVLPHLFLDEFITHFVARRHHLNS